MQLETDRLLLRRLTQADAHEFFQTVGDPEVMRYWGKGAEKTVEDTCRRITEMEEHWVTHGFGDWAVMEKNTGELIGFCGLHYIENMAEVNLGYAFKKTKWRQGFGFESCKAVLAAGFGELGLDPIVAVIQTPNIASRKLVEKLNLVFWKEFVYKGNEVVGYIMTPERFQAERSRLADYSSRI
ncbi:GNAT family N-acetyltransferase [Candidatus Hydrogenedentota bacterium]